MKTKFLHFVLPLAALVLVWQARAAELPAPPPDLLGNWTFDTDAASGTGGWTGTLRGGAAVGQAGGVVGTGCHRNETGEGFVDTNLTSLDARLPFTVSVWFRTNANTGASDALFGWGGSGFNGHWDVGLKGGDLHFLLERSSATIAMPTPLNNGQWHHLLVSYNPPNSGASIKNTSIYLNGKAAGSPTEAISYQSWTKSGIRIGSGYQRTLVTNGPPERDFNGSIDDFAFFNTGLSAGDAALIHGLAKLTGASAASIQSARLLSQSPVGAVAELDGRLWTRVSGLTGSTGDYGGSVAAGDAWIALNNTGDGIRLLAPVPPDPNPLALQGVPATLTVRSGDRGSFPFQLRNTGSNPVEWKLKLADPSGGDPSLDGVLGAFIRNSPALLGSLPTQIDFTGGVTGTQIDNSPFSGGNILKTSVGGPIPYSDGVIANTAALGTGGRHFTLKLPGLFLFAGDCNGPAWFESGGLIAGYHAPEALAFNLNHAGRTWKAFATRRGGGATSPAVNQLVLVNDAGASQNALPGYSSQDMNIRINFSGKRRICYAAFTVAPNLENKWKPFEDLARAILDLQSDVPSGMTIQPAQGNVAAGGVTSPTLEVDALGLPPGSHALAIDAQPAAGGAENVRAPFTLVVDEPAIRFAGSSIDRAGIDGGPSETVTLGTASNTGSQQAWTASLIGADSWVSLNTTSGTTPQSVSLRFTPPASGAAGIYRASLEVRSGTSTYQIPITYTFESWNPIGMVLDPLRDTAYVMNNSSYGGVVVAISPSTRNVKKAIRVGTAPSDIAFSPDGSTVYVFCASAPEIFRIDAATMEVTASRRVTGTAYNPSNPSLFMGRLTCGPNGRVYYTDASSPPALRMLDFESGAILATLTQADIPKVTTTISTGFGDLWFDPHARQLFFTRRGFGFTGYPQIGRLDITGDTLNFANEWIVATNNSISSSSHIFADLDGKRFFMDTLLFERADMNKSRALYESQVLDISAYGDLVLTQSAVHDATSGQKLATLPITAWVAAFTANQEGVLYHAGFGQFRYWPLPTAIRPPAVAIRPDPPSGGAIEMGKNTLRWSSLPLVDGYRIYIGGDAAAVAAALPGSAMDKGLVTTNSFIMDPAPKSGTFYWRIDAIRGGSAIKGGVHSFSVASFRVTPVNVNIVAPQGALPQKVNLSATDGDGNPVAWSASSTSSWIKFPQASGTSSAPLRVDLDPAGLAPGSYAGTVRVTGGGLTIEVPVSLQLFATDLFRMRPDPNRPVVYGLQTGQFNGQPGYILPIDIATGKYISAIPLEKYAIDFAVHPLEDRLYVPLAYDKRIQVFDLKTGQQLPAITLDASFGNLGRIAPGRSGRILLDVSDSSSSSFARTHLLDSASGRSMAILDDGYTTSYRAVGICDSGGNRFYRASQGLIQRVDVSTDVPALLESGNSTSSTNAGWQHANLAISRDGSRVLSDQTILTADMRRITSVEANCHAITGDGQVVAGPTGLYWAETGFKAANLPLTIASNQLSETLVMLSSDDRYLLIWDNANLRVLSYPLSSLVTLPGPVPKPGQQLSEKPGSLSWGSVAGATEYQIFLGTSQTAVTTAGVSSPLRIGSSQTNSIALSQPMAYGYRYYWRVDALTPTGTVKGTVHFFDLPFQSSGNPIVQPGTISSYESGFGSRLAPGPDGLMAGHSPSVKWFEFDWTTGSHRYAQELREGETYSSGGFDIALAAGLDLMVAGNPRFGEPATDAGATFIHRKAPDGTWFRTSRLPFPPDGSTSYFGNALAYGGNQLLIQQGSLWETSGKVFPYFEWPDWRRGPELVPSPRETNDFFGAAIALDGSRALIGAPGSGPFVTARKGSAFIFEYDAPGKQWVQRARLQPALGETRDYAGYSLALAGNHAALGSANQSITYKTSKVHVFNRRSATSWLQNATLDDPAPNPDAAFGSLFGRSLAIHGDILFVSAPYALWRGQRGGVVYPYRYNGTGWDAMAPIVPPPGGEQFGAAMAVHNGWLFISHYKEGTSAKPGNIFTYRIAETLNRQPLFVSKPPIQIVRGRTNSIDVQANDPDGNSGLVFRPADLPPGLTLQNLGNGKAAITGIPTDTAGTERWLRIAVADAQGSEAVQTSLVKVLAIDDLPVPGGLPGSLEVVEGEELVLAPAIGGSGPFTLQWKRDGNDLPNETKASLIIPGLGFNESGKYSVRVTNVVGSVTSGEVKVTVRPANRFAGDWTSYGSGNNHDGFQAAALGRHKFQLAWQAAAQPGYGLNPVAIASGRVFVTPRNYHNAMQARAYDLATGTLVWSHQFASANALNIPTWHNGRLYLQRNDWSNSETWCLNATTGIPVWNTRYSNVAPNYGTPVADGNGIYAAGGYGAGVYGYNLDGSQRFLRYRSDHSPWMPSLSNGRLFTWDGKIMSEIDILTGNEIWTLARSNYSAIESFPLVLGSRAYLVEYDAILCVNLDTRRVVWETPGVFGDKPAFGGGRLFVLSGTSVIALSPDNGRELARYSSGAPNSSPLQGQPLVVNDHLISCNSEKTFVFHLETGKLVQTIPYSGYPAYSAGYLVIAGNDNILRGYFANAAPEFAVAMPAMIPSGPAAADLMLPVGSFTGDPDPNDPLTWRIKNVTRPELFRTLAIDGPTGNLTVVYNPWQSGESDVTLTVTDSAGNVTESTITFTVPEHPVPQLGIAAKLVLNRQTGLYEHQITVTNSGAREIAGFDLKITGLPAGVTVNNASARDGNDWIIHHRQPLAAGAKVTLVVEYYTPVRGTVLNPQVTVGIITVPEAHPAAPGGGLAVESCTVLADGSVMIEFATTPGVLYEIHYSDDAANWKLSPVRVRAAGNRVQWIDNGPPRTETSPSGKPCRFYRARALPQS